MLKLTAAAVAKYVGGQMEIQNHNERYLYRGEIDSITVEDDLLQVTFAWLAKGEGFPPIPKKWVKDEKRDYVASLGVYIASDIGDGRLCLDSPIVGELVVLFPPNGSKLDPSKVEGLQAVQA
jgi:hypothetical protein